MLVPERHAVIRRERHEAEAERLAADRRPGEARLELLRHAEARRLILDVPEVLLRVSAHDRPVLRTRASQPWHPGPPWPCASTARRRASTGCRRRPIWRPTTSTTAAPPRPFGNLSLGLNTSPSPATATASSAWHDSSQTASATLISSTSGPPRLT